jgi:hypothetical protein
MRDRVSNVVGFLGTECLQCFSTLANANILEHPKINALGVLKGRRIYQGHAKQY